VLHFIILSPRFRDFAVRIIGHAITIFNSVCRR
jgi:hypothetical protein